MDAAPKAHYQNFLTPISYGYHRYMTRRNDGGILGGYYMDRLTMKNPATEKTHVFADNYGKPGIKANSALLIGLSEVKNFSFNVNAVHGRGMNSAFLDGHAALVTMSHWNIGTTANDLWNVSKNSDWSIQPVYNTNP
jgi:hypothetical protein